MVTEGSILGDNFWSHRFSPLIIHCLIIGWGCIYVIHVLSSSNNAQRNCFTGIDEHCTICKICSSYIPHLGQLKLVDYHYSARDCTTYFEINILIPKHTSFLDNFRAYQHIYDFNLFWIDIACLYWWLYNSILCDIVIHRAGESVGGYFQLIRNSSKFNIILCKGRRKWIFYVD